LNEPDMNPARKVLNELQLLTQDAATLAKIAAQVNAYEAHKEFLEQQKALGKRVDDRQRLMEQFDPLEAFRSKLIDFAKLNLPENLLDAAIANARKEAVDKLAGQTPTMQSTLTGGARGSAEAAREIMEIYRGTQNPQLKAQQEANQKLDKIEQHMRKLIGPPKVAAVPG
jgi:hypothetical protein